MASTASSNFFRHWFRVEIIPIYCVTAVAVGGATWYLSRLARGPDVIWDRTPVRKEEYIFKEEGSEG
ncbi:hypothetical protein G9A89_005005 [Geosiphon pyriformis]|nr:hypothetical protein G9A89_005005 [Geosiphon pyriformis]